VSRPDIITLSTKALQRDMDTALKKSYQQGFDEGLQAGFQGLIGTMLNQGCHPHFLAKVTKFPKEHIQTIDELRLKEQAHE